MSSGKWWPFCLGLSVLNQCMVWKQKDLHAFACDCHVGQKRYMQDMFLKKDNASTCISCYIDKCFYFCSSIVHCGYIFTGGFHDIHLMKCHFDIIECLAMELCPSVSICLLKTVRSPLLTHWRYANLAQSHWFWLMTYRSVSMKEMKLHCRWIANPSIYLFRRMSARWQMLTLFVPQSAPSHQQLQIPWQPYNRQQYQRSPRPPWTTRCRLRPPRPRLWYKPRKVS